MAVLVGGGASHRCFVLGGFCRSRFMQVVFRYSPPHCTVCIIIAIISNSVNANVGGGVVVMASTFFQKQSRANLRSK